MYLHLGNNLIVYYNDIMGIFDLDNTTISKFTREYLAKAQKENRVINVSYELPKSFVVCQTKSGDEIVYISQLSSATLNKRIKNQDLLGLVLKI